MVGLSASGNFFRRDAIGSFNAKLGHFVFNRLNVGLGAEYRTTGNLSYQQLGGAYARYYFMNKKITPFGEANYFRGKSISRIDQQKLEASHIAASVGLAFTGILNRFGLEAYQEFNFETIGTTKSNYGLLSVRLNFIF